MTESSWDRLIYDPLARQNPYEPWNSDRPYFNDEASAERWLAARREALDLVLAAVARSEWSERLVLRGSVLLKAWFGAKARDPADVDFVADRTGRNFDHREFDEIFRDIAIRAAARSGERVRIDPELAGDGVAERIWTYGSATTGRRVILAWDCPEHGIDGTLQLDFAFGETLADEPQYTKIPRCGHPGPRAKLRTATPHESLAWKVRWLISDEEDSAPRGKDLYDAVLLAEHCDLSPELLRRALAAASGIYTMPKLSELQNLAQHVNWADFCIDYPLLEDAHEEFVRRLVIALAPAFPLG